MARFQTIPADIMHLLLQAGYRRHGDICYAMRCPTCRMCQPIRLDPRTFIPNRSQKRTLRGNNDLTISQGPVQATQEKLNLLKKFFDLRYPGRDNTCDQYYQNFFNSRSGFTREILLHDNALLLGVAIVDLVAETFLNAVYFFFDPEAHRRSPGTFNILNLLSLCSEQGIHEFYLGYWLKEVRSMSYKANFRPHELLTGDTWFRQGT